MRGKIKSLTDDNNQLKDKLGELTGSFDKLMNQYMSLKDNLQQATQNDAEMTAVDTKTAFQNVNEKLSDIRYKDQEKI